MTESNDRSRVSVGVLQTAWKRPARIRRHVARSDERVLTGVRPVAGVNFEVNPGAVAHVMDQLDEDEAVEICYTVGVAPEDIALGVDLQAVGETPDKARERAETLEAVLDAGLDLACPHLQFRERRRPALEMLSKSHLLEVKPRWWVLQPTEDVGGPRKAANATHLVPLAGESDHRSAQDEPLQEVRQRAILFDRPVSSPQFVVDPLLRALQRFGEELEIIFRLESIKLDARDVRTLRNATRRLTYAPEHRLTDLVRGPDHAIDHGVLQRRLQHWLDLGRGFRCRCLVASDQPLDNPFFSMIGHLVFGEPPFEWELEVPPEALDVRGAIPGALPVLYPFPTPNMVLGLGFPRLAPRPPRFPASGGNRIGATEDGFGVHLAKSDRLRHTYVIGATGTGKSTLLLNMIRQDMKSGGGVVLVDPHGDLFAQALRAVPSRRKSDLVVVDFSNFDQPVGLNLLETRGGPHQEIEQNFICNELIRIFTRVLYRGVPEVECTPRLRR